MIRPKKKKHFRDYENEYFMKDRKFEIMKKREKYIYKIYKCWK